MKNIEKYFDELMKDEIYPMCVIRKEILGDYNCSLRCRDCEKETIKWLNEEYTEPRNCETCIHSHKINSISQYIYCGKAERLEHNNYSCKFWKEA